MQSGDLILDDEGHLWHWPFAALAQSLGSVRTGARLANYAIRNLGFISLRLRPQGLVLSFRRGLARPQTMADAIRLLLELPDQRIVLSFLDLDWQHRVCRGPAEAIDELIGLLQGSHEEGRSFLCRAMDTGCLSERSQFAHVLRFWGNHPAAFDHQNIGRVLQGPLRGRYLVVAAVGDQETLMIEHWGEGLGSYDPTWARRARGVPLRDQPDYRYGCAAAEAYATALRHGMPVLEDVDAIVTKPRKASVRLRYKRLILPFRRTDGEVRLLGTSLLDPAIDLRGTRHVG
jgi:hypothetical protein